MKPPAPVSAEISVEIARMPVGRIAAMKPEPSAFTSFGSRIGSPAMKGARAIDARDVFGRFRAFGALDEGAAGGRRRPGLPLQIVGLDRLTEADVALGDQHVDRLQLRDGRGSRLVVRPARKICGYAAGNDGNGKNCDACGIHTLHFPHYSATLPPL